MALLHAAARLGPVLEGDDLVGAIVADDLGADDGPGDERAADRGLVAVGDEQDAVEGDRLAGLGVEKLDLELRADLDAVLLPAGLDDCVHGSPRGCSAGVTCRPRVGANERPARLGREWGVYGARLAPVKRRPAPAQAPSPVASRRLRAAGRVAGRARLTPPNRPRRRREDPDAHPVDRPLVDQCADPRVPERGEAADPAEVGWTWATMLTRYIVIRIPAVTAAAARLSVMTAASEVTPASRRRRATAPAGGEEPAGVEPGSNERSHHEDTGDRDERERGENQQLADDRRAQVARRVSGVARRGRPSRARRRRRSAASQARWRRSPPRWATGSSRCTW